MSYEQLKKSVCDANKALVEAGLVVLTFGNAGAVDRQQGVMAIKPSGVAYGALRPKDIVVVSLEDGKVIEGAGRPSSDTPTYLHLFRSLPTIGAIVHTHSTFATSFAQAGREIPCLGTTQADHFYGSVPVTRALGASEIEGEYEENTGKVIVELFGSGRIDAEKVPGVLVVSHGPFAWGPTPQKAVENAVVLEFAAQTALWSLMANPGIVPISETLLDKHFLRKHGLRAYYGQGEDRVRG